MIDEAGLGYAPPPGIPNSMASLQVGEFARDAGALDLLHPLLFRAYWSDGRDIGDLGVLTDVAAASGLDAEEALAAVREDRYRDRVRGSTEVAVEAGVSGVPSWLIDDRFLVPGAQPHEVFDRVMARLGHVPVDPAA